MAVEVEFLTSTSTTNISTNFQRVKTALADAVSRSGDLPNNMSSDLDMDDNDILNVKSLEVDSLIVNGVDLDEAVDRAEAAVILAEEFANEAEAWALVAAGATIPLDSILPEQLKASEAIGFRDVILGDNVHFINDFGAVGDGIVDDAPAFRLARDMLPSGSRVIIPEGEYLLDSLESGDIVPFIGSNANKGISWEGVGWDIITDTIPGQPYAKPSGTILKIGSSTPDTANAFRIVPTTITSGHRFSNLAIIPYNGALGTPKGKNAIFIDADDDNGLIEQLIIDNVYIDNMATGVSIHSKARVTSGSGGLAYSTIRNSKLMCVSFEYVGDSVRVYDNTIGYNCLSDNPAIYAYNVTGAANFTTQGNNLANNYGPLILFDGGTNPAFLFEELEWGNGLTNLHGALVDMRGSISTIYSPLMLGGTYSMNSTAGKVRTIRLGNTVNAQVDKVRLGSANEFAFTNPTITIASPGVFTWNGHGLAANDLIILSTDGALPTGLAAGNYYVKTVLTVNTFTVSSTPGGAVINTSGTQSGNHQIVIFQSESIEVTSAAVNTIIGDNFYQRGGSNIINSVNDLSTTTKYSKVEDVWTPIVSSSSGTITSYTATGRYSLTGRCLEWKAEISITNNGTGAGFINMTLPRVTGTQAAGFGKETAVTSATITGSQFAAGNNVLIIHKYDGTYPGGTSYNLLLSGHYFI